MALDCRHHAFLQSLMARGPQPAADAKKMFGKLFDLDGDIENEFFEFLGEYNKKLDMFQLEIKGSTYQYDGTKYFGVVNKHADEHAKMGTHYSYPQIAYFRSLVEAVSQDPTGHISSIDALNLHVDHTKEQETEDPSSSQAKAASLKLSLAQREKLLHELHEDKWLTRTDDGTIALGVRSFLELRSFFKNLDIPFCDVCNEVGVKATLCRECPTRMHTYCAQVKFARPDVPRVCPSCRAAWNCEGLDLQQSQPGERSSSRAKHPRRRRTSTIC